MKTLVHNQQIRTTRDRYEPEIKVGTVEGYSRKYQQDVEQAVKDALERGHALAWTSKAAAFLVADYPGKAEASAKAHAAYEAAVLIEDGELVEIEGRKYKVVYAYTDMVSDPVHFKAVV
jgi:hypothetical protein